MSEARLVACSIVSGAGLVAAAVASIGGTRTEPIACLFAMFALFYLIPTTRGIVGSLRREDVKAFLTGKTPE